MIWLAEKSSCGAKQQSLSHYVKLVRILIKKMNDFRHGKYLYIALTQKLLNFKIKKVLTFAIHDEVIDVIHSLIYCSTIKGIILKPNRS